MKRKEKAMNHDKLSRHTIWLTRISVTALLISLGVLTVLDGTTISTSRASELPVSEPVWQQSTQGLGSGNVYDLAISPDYVGDQTVLAVTSGHEGAGIVWNSTDAGNTWRATSQGITDTGMYVIRISPNFAMDETVFAATTYGPFKSTDGGATWSKLTNGLPEYWPQVYDIVISPDYANDQTVFAAVYYDGVYKSTDGGAIWTQVNNGLPPQSLRVDSLAISPNYSNDQTIFAGFREFVGDRKKGIAKSIDGGQSWVVDYSLTAFDLAISSGYATDQTIFAGQPNFFDLSEQLLKSTDGGQTWQDVTPSVGYGSPLVLSPDYPTDHTVFAESGESLGTLVKSIDGGASWI